MSGGNSYFKHDVMTTENGTLKKSILLQLEAIN